MPLLRIPRNPTSAYLRALLESEQVFDVCYHKPPHPAIWCGAIYETEQDLVNTYNAVAEQYVTTAKYLTFCPLCLTYFGRWRPRYVRKIYNGYNAPRVF